MGYGYWNCVHDIPRKSNACRTLMNADLFPFFFASSRAVPIDVKSIHNRHLTRFTYRSQLTLFVSLSQFLAIWTNEKRQHSSTNKDQGWRTGSATNSASIGSRGGKLNMHLSYRMTCGGQQMKSQCFIFPGRVLYHSTTTEGWKADFA